VLLSIALLAGALLLRHRRRRAMSSALSARQPTPPLAPGGRAAAGERFVSVPWELIAAPPDDPSLTIRYRSDEQMELDRVDAQETPTQVFVTALMRWRPPAGGWFAYAEEHEALVPLSRPLGERELVHAPVDEPGGPPLYP
jgi:hypothetical protein